MTKKKNDCQKGIDNLTDEQMKAIKETERNLSSALQMLFECQDLYLSDIRNLEQSMWDLRRTFDLDKKDW
jgi:hypothetical protein